MKINIINKRFGRLTVIKEAAERGSNGKLRYICKCDCGNEHITSGESLRKGKTKSCGCLKKEFIEKNKFKREEDRIKAIMKVQYKHIETRNKQKGFNEIIDFETFVKLSFGSCFYCGLEYSKVIEDRACESKAKRKISNVIVKINGIDRVDSNKGYSSDNVVTCCKHCNSAKNTRSQKEFFEWIKKVYEHNRQRIENAAFSVH